LKGTKSTHKKSVAFLYTNKELPEKEIHNTLKKVKCLGIKLTKDLENSKTLKKEIGEDIKRWKDSHLHGLAKLIL
jgi:hypothetical protein